MTLEWLSEALRHVLAIGRKSLLARCSWNAL
nr:MAG TPA: hypothetical protein [Caudoviricetes sp.]